MSTDLKRRWSMVPPFRTLPEDALRTRLSLPVDGSQSVSGLAGVDDSAGPVAAPAYSHHERPPRRLDESPVAWLADEPVLWPLLPLWPLLADTYQALTVVGREVAGPTAPALADSYLRSLLGDVRRLACRAAANDAARLPAAVEPSDLGRRNAEAKTAEALAVRYAERAAAEFFADHHRPLIHQIGHVLAAHRTAFAEMLKRLRADWPTIRTLVEADEPAQLQVARVVGDLHERGAVVLLGFGGASKLLYKPRSLALECRLAEMLRWLDSRQPGLAPRVPRSVDRGAYGWQEFVEWSPADSAADVIDFYHRSGALVALAYLLRATDLHYENVLCDGRSPVLVDPECLFGSSFRTQADGVDEMAGVRAATVLDAGLLPDPGQRGDLPTALDLSMLGAIGERRHPRQIRELRVDEHGQNEFVMRSLPQEDPTHMPVLDGAVVSVLGHEATVVDGFRRTYDLFLSDRDHLESLLAGFAEVRVRHIVRPTWQYGKILFELGHPESAASAVKQEEIVNTLWPANAHERPLALRLFEQERRGLLRGCIPTFERRAGEVGLWSTGQVVHPEALPVSGLDLVRQRLRALSPADADLQTRIVRAALRLIQMPADARARQSYHPVVAAVPHHTAVLRAATDIRDSLTAEMADTRGRAWWLSGVEVSDGMFGVRPSPFGLYDGAAGIALFAGYLDIVTGSRSRLAEAATSAMLADVDSLLKHSTLEQVSRNRQLGVLNGAWGVVYVAACLGRSGWDASLLRWARDMATRLAYAPPPMSSWDLVGGSAGIAATAAELATHLGQDGYGTAARAALDATAVQLERLLRHGEIQCGVAHGLSGAALAFARADRLLPGEDFARAVRVCLDAERSQRRLDAGGWHDALLARDGARQETKRQSWCRGGAGIGLIRLALADLDAEGATAGEPITGAEEDTDLELAVRLTIEHGFGRDQSLCHGAMGSLELLRAAGRRAEYDKYLGGVLAAGRRDGWRTGLPRPVPDPGLFTGLAGVGFGLLRHLAPETVPRVLTLSLPGNNEAERFPSDGGQARDA
ncbi:type 2 lantipeptide synthetase LanM family protein [Micromonospora sp. NIE79]|uniref:Type 2 lantipeptide synthetase LanM family protein n=1 Tax=Micromonospora trifolii TaxID=2911208 RepID=A0ABS9N1Q9_9ACTN|nr:type 2 lanthipeptide synthetase LanM family protein [Micromonospora trifolii]MCG5443902.1 type 2 lantipeptide synthetase LanM family protein [Micromonospora trifolii]